jgi:hypothetical protein
MKIFIGTEEIASLLTDLAYGFKKLGIPVTTYKKSYNKFYASNRYDISRGSLLNDIFKYQNWKFLSKKMRYYAERVDEIVTAPYLKLRNRKLINDHDVFIFIWRPWLHESYLFPLLKKKGKKIVCIHVGTDVRHISAYKQQYHIDTSTWEDDFKTDPLDSKIMRIRYHELYADMIYSVPDQAGLYLRPYNHFRIPLRQDKNIRLNIPARKVPLIVHAPSRTGIKGTDIINRTMEQLKNDGYRLEYKFIQNMPNEQLLELLSEADILCDELYLHGPAMLSAEAMAAGCAVATRCLNVPPFQPPVCPVTPDNLYEQLKKLITDIDYRVALANAGKKFVDDFNDPVKIAEKILNDLKQPGKQEYESLFFMEKYELPQNVFLTDETKSLTGLVIEKYGLQDRCKKNGLKKRGLI